MLKSLQFADGGKFSFPVFDYYYNVYFINGRDYETELIHLASKINQDFVFFDGGANMGYISSTFLHISKCCKKVVSIEPNPNLLPILKFNLDDVQSTNNFSIVSKAISNKSDVIDNFVIQRHAGSGLAKNGHSGGNSISIETVSLNELIEDFSRPSCFNLIKLDLEGAEFDALEGFNFFYNSALIIEFLYAEGEL
ncbi:FkbM family methyltransferase, partial [Flavobacterium sp.]|uniref:FkbM family methyltransferase n=1 Tax=Flavobacterium sp. TaxID=239 RepID=UPI003BCA1B08